MSAAKHTPGPWVVPNAHLRVLLNIEAGRGAWFGAERPKQRGFRGGLLTSLKAHGMIDWTKDEVSGLARYFLTDAGRAAIAKATGSTS